jgi:hypothetical protein
VLSLGGFVLSNYLIDVHAFETAINRGKLSSRSARLDQVVGAVKLYCTHATEPHLEDVIWKFQAWKHDDPKEFKDRGAPLERDFMAEIDAGLSRFPNAPAPHAPLVAVNRYRLAKQAGKIGLSAASKGVSAAQYATHAGTTSVVAAAVAGAAVSATGIGLAVVAGAATIGSSVLAATSAVKTDNHIKALLEIHHNRNEYTCLEISQDGIPQSRSSAYSTKVHEMIGNNTLPYIIQQKNNKYTHKVVAAIPLIGVIETVRASVNKAHKYATGELGAKRKEQARFLAEHFIHCDCGLSNAIVTELYNMADMEWLRSEADYDQVTEALALKMKTT